MKTPTAVADFLVQRLLNFEMRLNATAIEIQKLILRKIKTHLKMMKLQIFMM